MMRTWEDALLKVKDVLLVKPVVYLPAFILWALTSVLAVWEILLVRSLSARVLTRYFVSQGSPSELLAAARAHPLSNLVALPMTFLALLIVVGGFDFHLGNVGKRRSWVIFAWTLGIQITILVLCYMF
jgi:hypothetical protein